jgi:hypothetical protein
MKIHKSHFVSYDFKTCTTKYAYSCIVRKLTVRPRFSVFVNFGHVTHICEHTLRNIRRRTHNCAGSIDASLYKC